MTLLSYNTRIERAEIEVQALVFDAENAEHIATHGVTPADVIEVLEIAPHFFTNLSGRSASNVVVGPNRAGRFLFVAIVSADSEGRGDRLRLTG